MLFSAPIFKRCQHCLGLIEQPSMISGNTIGARIWTDGKMDAPMLPELPQIVKCPHCSACMIKGLQRVNPVKASKAKRSMGVMDTQVTVLAENDQDYIPLTYMLRAKDGNFFVSDWLRNRNVIQFLGIWETVYNPDSIMADSPQLKVNRD